MARHLSIGALAVLALAACGGRGKSKAPWLTAVDPASHAAWFPLVGTAHDPTVPGTTVSCSGCHTSATFSTFSCTGCHAQPATDPIHAGVVAGYAWESGACYSCHRDGSAGVVDHAPFFPIGAGTSHALACAGCHGDPVHRQDLGTLACASCHGGRSGFAAVHAGVEDFPASASSADCLRCHADDRVERVADHQARFPIASGSATHDTACLQCHAQSRTDKPYAADFAAFSCTACHGNPDTDSAHAGVAGYSYASAACYQCHPTGSAAPADHSARAFPIGTGTAHEGVTCSQCHTDLSHPTDPAAFACDACHLATAGFAASHQSPASGISILAVHTSRSASTQLPLTSPSCLRCHADSQVDAVASHPSGEDTPRGNGDHRDAGCLTCHSAQRSDKPFAASFDREPGCSTCHPNGTGG
jgi:nitrate/TMAO reductase-like tetraheme cytochrome c subunit